MDTYIDSRIVILNSSNAILLNGSYKSDVNFNFTGLIKNEDNIQQIQVSINSFKYYLSELKIIDIPVGNYNATSLINIMNTLIGNSEFLITISRVTGILKFSYPNDL